MTAGHKMLWTAGNGGSVSTRRFQRADPPLHSDWIVPVVDVVRVKRRERRVVGAINGGSARNPP